MIARDGTTDVTRTVHYGTPTEYEKEMYTRVLLGNLDLERIVFPEREEVSGDKLNIYARIHLWHVGKDYRHGTGHGVGHFSGVHENPVGITSFRKNPFKEGYVCTNGKVLVM